MMSIEQALDYAREYGVSDRELVGLIRNAAEERRFAQESVNVTLNHPELGVEVSNPPEAVDQLTQSGWVLKQPPLDEEPAVEPPVVDVSLPDEDEEQ